MSQTLIHGDCLEKMNDIPDKSIDMIFCDMPYGITKCFWDVKLDLIRLWAQYKRIGKEHCAIVLTAAQPFSTELIVSNFYNFRYEWIIEKTSATGHLNSKKRPMTAHEVALVFCFGKERYFPQGLVPKEKRQYKNPNNGLYTGAFKFATTTHTNYPKSILRFNNHSSNSRKHSSTKPIPMIEYFIRTYTLEGEIVLDNCMGSGTTGEACKNTDRSFIGIEKYESIFKDAESRLK